MIFNDVSDNGVEKVKILNDFAFVHFVTRQQAEKAKDALQSTCNPAYYYLYDTL